MPGGGVLERTTIRFVLPPLRRVEFPGKRRLRGHLRLPQTGAYEVGFSHGVRMHLNVAERIQRDYLAGLHDRRELGLVRRLLRDGGDFVDVGAHIGIYSITAALALRERGRVVALEPNPAAREQLERNLRLNGCTNVEVVPKAASSAPGHGLLRVPDTPNPSFSTLGDAAFPEGTPVPVELTTVDREVAARCLSPAIVKVDAEHHELEVLEGMRATLSREPAILVEVGAATAEPIQELLSGWTAFRVVPLRLTQVASLSPPSGKPPRGIELVPAAGSFNALFVPASRLAALRR
jgi:FkbM family methyltransferase